MIKKLFSKELLDSLDTWEKFYFCNVVANNAKKRKFLILNFNFKNGQKISRESWKWALYRNSLNLLAMVSSFSFSKVCIYYCVSLEWRDDDLTLETQNTCSC